MSKRWLVIDTNVFSLPEKQDVLPVLMLAAVEFLNRIIEWCDEYGLAVDEEGLILEEYFKKIPPKSFGAQALMAIRDLPNKIGVFRHKNPSWLETLADSHQLDAHDRRFLATAAATPDKVLVSEDTVFLQNKQVLKQHNIHVYSIEEASESV
ncbi:MAG: hypothetical protein RMK65_06215 [Anaerolineae bacterium]|nr:hypothetical protein [Anaerolineae bacterium]MCX8068715.1 hypothetical protein [Anaerolineae bacterium]MDW7991725.1 hypothetical protein [Anaerolineae bacterium]